MSGMRIGPDKKVGVVGCKRRKNAVFLFAFFLAGFCSGETTNGWVFWARRRILSCRSVCDVRLFERERDERNANRARQEGGGGGGGGGGGL